MSEREPVTEANRGTTSPDSDFWRAYIGREEVRCQLIDWATLHRYAAAVGSQSADVHLPPLVHWAYFNEVVASDELGTDGHPKRGGGLIPPIHLPRRMFAGASMQFIQPLLIGQEADLVLRLSDVKQKQSAHGELVFVEIERLLRQSNCTRISERQTIVYRRLDTPIAPVMRSEGAGGEGEETWVPDTVDLFRFSAVTFNAHRIHYDLPYTQSQEGYPDLVVHGPLTAAKLFAFAQRQLRGPLRAFSFRIKAPLFVKQPIRLRAGAQPGEFEAVRCDGVVAVTATANAAEFQ